MLVYQSRCGPAGIATTLGDQSIAWRPPRFVLASDPCCEALHATDSTNALPAATNHSTQHEPNTGFPASFASESGAVIIGLAALFAAVVAVVANNIRKRRRRVPASELWDIHDTPLF